MENPDDGFEATRWFRVVDPEGKLWRETSSLEEAEEAMRPGDSLEHLYQKTVSEWRPIVPRG